MALPSFSSPAPSHRLWASSLTLWSQELGSLAATETTSAHSTASSALVYDATWWQRLDFTVLDYIFFFLLEAI